MSPLTSTMVVPALLAGCSFHRGLPHTCVIAGQGFALDAGEVLLEAQPVPLGKPFVANLVHDLPDEVSPAPAQSDLIQGLSAKPGGVRSLATIDEAELQAIRMRLAVQFDLLVTPILVGMPDNVAQRFVDGERDASALLDPQNPRPRRAPRRCSAPRVEDEDRSPSSCETSADRPAARSPGVRGRSPCRSS